MIDFSRWEIVVQPQLITIAVKRLFILADGRSWSNRNGEKVIVHRVNILADGRSWSNRNRDQSAPRIAVILADGRSWSNRNMG